MRKLSIPLVIASLLISSAAAMAVTTPEDRILDKNMKSYVQCLFKTYATDVRRTGELKYKKNALQKACSVARSKLPRRQLSSIERIAFRGINNAIKQAKKEAKQ